MSGNSLTFVPLSIASRVTTKDTDLSDDNVIKRRSPSSITEISRV